MRWIVFFDVMAIDGDIRERTLYTKGNNANSNKF